MGIFDSKKILKLFSTVDSQKNSSIDQSLTLSEDDQPLNKRTFTIKVVTFALAIIVPYLLLVEFFLKEEKITGSDTFITLEEEAYDWVDNPTKYPEFDGDKVYFVDLYVALINYDDRENVATYRIDIAPSSALGLWDSGGQFLLNKSVRLNIDSLDVGSVGDFDADMFYGSIEVSVIGINLFESDLTNSNYFPFENKFSKLTGYAFYSDSKTIEEALEEDNFQDLPVRIIDYTQDLEGYRIKYDYLTIENGEYVILDDLDQVKENLYQGSFDLLLTIKRDRATIFSVFVLMTFVVGAAIALLLMTIVVWSKRRPPALASLIWGAATIFAIIETRRFIPNTPRVGVYMDLYLFFPSILISIFATSSLFALWIRRKDWVA